jgi:hypothetical protein
MVEAFRCSRCSAPVTDDNWTSCPFCGTVLSKPTINPLRAATSPARFAAVRKHPQLAELLQREPSVRHVSSGMLGLGVFGLIWVGMSLFITFGFMAAGAGAMTLFPLAIGGFGLAGIVKGLGKQGSIRKAPWEREIVVILDERTQVSGGGEHSSATTQYFALVQRENGERREFACRGEQAGKLATGDIGVAYIKADHLVDFERIDV